MPETITSLLQSFVIDLFSLTNSLTIFHESESSCTRSCSKSKPIRKTLSGSFKMFKFLKRLDICVFVFKKCIIRSDFFVRPNVF